MPIHALYCDAVPSYSTVVPLYYGVVSSYCGGVQSIYLSFEQIYYRFIPFIKSVQKKFYLRKNKAETVDIPFIFGSSEKCVVFIMHS